MIILSYWYTSEPVSYSINERIIRMNAKVYHVVLSNGGYFIVRRIMPDDVIEFTGSYAACLHFINPVLY